MVSVPILENSVKQLDVHLEADSLGIPQLQMNVNIAVLY